MSPSCLVDHECAQTIDALSGPEERQKIVAFYSLPADFDFASLDNCLPSCSRCNRLKSNRTFEMSPALLLMLGSVRMQARLARMTADKFAQDERKAKILVRIEAAVAKEILRRKISKTF